MVELRTITCDNFDECIGLSVSDTQRNYVTPNVDSLALAWVTYDTARPFAIYADGTMVGFIMMMCCGENAAHEIRQFMIDERFQGRGYGKEALNKVIGYLIHEHSASEIFLAYNPENKVAERMYKNAGFKKTGEIRCGEVVMVLNNYVKGASTCHP